MWYHFCLLGLSYFSGAPSVLYWWCLREEGSPRLGPSASGWHFSEISLACNERRALPRWVLAVRDFFFDDPCHIVSLTGQRSLEPSGTQRFLKLGAYCARISLPVLPGLLGFLGGSLGAIRERDYTPRHLSAGHVWCSAWRDSHLETSPSGLPSAARRGLEITRSGSSSFVRGGGTKLPCCHSKPGPSNSLTSSFQHSVSFW